jgi:hypothetical protein
MPRDPISQMRETGSLVSSNMMVRYEAGSNSFSRSLAAWIWQALSIMSHCTSVGRSARSSGHQLLSRYSRRVRSMHSSLGQSSLGGHDVLSCLRESWHGLGLQDTLDPRELVSDAHGQFVDLGDTSIQPLLLAESSSQRLGAERPTK